MTDHPVIRADSTEAMGRSLPRPKDGAGRMGDAPKSPPQEFCSCTQPEGGVKLRMCHYEIEKRCADFSLKIQQKHLEPVSARTHWGS